jgi:hypothetical protein
MKTDKAKETAKNLVGLYGTNEAIKIIRNELQELCNKCDFLNEVFEEIINLGTEVTEQQ